MRLKLIQLWCRPAMRWPSNASLDPATSSTAKSGKPHRNLTEKRRYHMVPVVLHAANAATASTIRSSNGVAPGLRGNDLLLEACQQQLPVGQGQTKIGDIAEIIGPVDLHHVGALLLTTSLGFHQPHNPSHASTPSHRTDAKNTPLALTPPISRQSLNYAAPGQVAVFEAGRAKIAWAAEIPKGKLKRQRKIDTERLALLRKIDSHATDLYRDAGGWLKRPNSGTMFAGRSPIGYLARDGREGIEDMLRRPGSAPNGARCRC
jgi:hypothetical protein